MHLDTYADYLRQVEPRTESRAVRAGRVGGSAIPSFPERFVTKNT